MWVAAEAGPWVEAHPRVPDSIITYASLVWAAAAYPLPQTGVRPEVAEQHWASWLQRRHQSRSKVVVAASGVVHFLRRGSARRLQGGVGRCRGGALGGGPPEGPR